MSNFLVSCIEQEDALKAIREANQKGNLEDDRSIIIGDGPHDPTKIYFKSIFLDPDLGAIELSFDDIFGLNSDNYIFHEALLTEEGSDLYIKKGNLVELVDENGELTGEYTYEFLEGIESAQVILVKVTKRETSEVFEYRVKVDPSDASTSSIDHLLNNSNEAIFEIKAIPSSDESKYELESKIDDYREFAGLQVKSVFEGEISEITVGDLFIEDSENSFDDSELKTNKILFTESVDVLEPQYTCDLNSGGNFYLPLSLLIKENSNEIKDSLRKLLELSKTKKCDGSIVSYQG